MNAITVPIDDGASAVRPFALMRECVLPVLERRRADLEKMYAPVMGRPETNPVLLTAVTVLQIMQRLSDRACAEACLYDARWRFALGDIPVFHPTTLVYFRNRLAENGKAKLVLEASLEAMRAAGYLKSCRAVRIDSTHLLARIADMSRLECVRETLRLALAFLAQFGGAAAWEPWSGRYADRNPEELRKVSPAGLAARMDAAGSDMRDVLAKADTLGKDGWHGYKAQVCERGRRRRVLERRADEGRRHRHPRPARDRKRPRQRPRHPRGTPVRHRPGMPASRRGVC